MPPEYLKYEVKSVEKESDKTYTIRLEPLSGEVPAYNAGQFFMIKNTNLAQEIRPKIKPYSALHPWRAGEISFGIKIHKDFSTGMCSLKPGQKVEICGPYGFFVLPEENKNSIVFLAGGIGITPLLTMIEKLAADKHSGKYYLFYSNREAKGVAYRTLLDKLSEENPNFELIYAMTGDEPLDVKNCEKGRISIGMIRKYVPDFDLADFYMCASKGFIESMKASFLETGISKERVHVEKW